MRELIADDRASTRQWLAIAIGSLLLSGLLALALVIGRVPVLSALFADPLIFRRFLVVHVDLALLVWFYAFLAALFSLLPLRRPPRPSRAPAVAAIGLLFLVGAGLVPGARPVLSNYVPVVDHPLFLAGLGLVGLALLAAFLGPRLFPANEAEEGFFRCPAAFRVGIRTAAVAFIGAMATFVAGVSGTPDGLPPEPYYELVFWGGGHVLQFASVAAMMSAWVLLVERASGRVPFGRAAALLLFGALVAPALASPLLTAGGTATPAYRQGFTTLMQWGIFPVVLVVLALCVRALRAARRAGELSWTDPSLLAFAASAVLTVLGFGIGALLHGSSTRVPGHYHASIGAVTAAFMGVAYPLLRAVGLPEPSRLLRRVPRWQPPVFAVGQAVFCVGLAIAGMPRKTYGAEQVIRTPLEQAGLWVMGIGGAVAVAAGVLFLAVVVSSWRRAGASAPLEGEKAWTNESTRFSA